MKLEVLCPAKINTFLAVGPKDRSGYHPLRTIFHAISLADTLTVERSSEDRITCNWEDLPTENTLTKTLRLMREGYVFPPLHIHLEKRIPAESGLGGGSSDAAGLLRALKRFCSASIPDAFVADVALAVGADVPFFLVGGAAKAEGYGETLEQIEDLPTKHLVVVRPNEGVHTGKAFNALDEKEYEWREFPQNSWELYNDFERVMPCVCDDWIERIQMLGAEAAGLTGSGSAIFGVFRSEEDARKAFEKADFELKNASNWESSGQAWLVRTLSRAESLQIRTIES